MKECEFKECDRQVRARGLCGGHYQQQRRGQPLRRLYGQYAGYKVCPTCRQDKPLSGFYSRKDGSVFSECRECCKARSVAAYRRQRGL